MAIRKYPERKVKILKAFLEAFQTYDQVILVNIMNISTSQIVKTRKKIRDRGGSLIIGKNKIALMAIKILTEDIP